MTCPTLRSLILGGAALVVVGCGDLVTGPNEDRTPLDPVTQVRAYSAGVTSVGLTWTPTRSASSPDMQDHLIRILTSSGGVETGTISVGTSLSEAIVTGLTEGTTYEFQVIARAVSGSASANSAAAAIEWAPARRLETTAGGQPIRLYETSSASNPSGLILFKSAAQGAVVASIHDPVPLSDTLLFDLYLQTINGTSLALRSAGTYVGRSIPRTTVFSSVVRRTASLDDPAAAPPDTSATYISSNTSILIDNSPEVVPKVLYVRTQDGNYGRVLLKLQGNGTFFGGTSPDRFIDLELSFQTAPLVQYSRAR